MICEQIMGVGSTDFKAFIQERNPNSFKATCDIAEQYLKAHGKSFRNWSASTVNNFGERGDARHNDNDGYRSANIMQRSNSSTGHSRQTPHALTTGGRNCWICSSVKHLAQDCPQNISKTPDYRNKSASGERTLACRDTLVFNGGLKLTTRQAGGVRYIEDNDGKRFQLREMTALAADKPKHMIVTQGVVSGRTELVDVLRDSGCSTMVIRKDLCDADDFTGEVRGCIMMDGRVVEVPVVKKPVNTPYYVGIVEGVAMNFHIYDLVIGNLQGARSQEDPDPRWEPPELQVAIKEIAEVNETTEEGTGESNHELVGGVVTRFQNRVKPLRPLKVTEAKIAGITRHCKKEI